jgi:hypothetical protein
MSSQKPLTRMVEIKGGALKTELKTLFDPLVAGAGYLDGLPGTGERASEQFAVVE